MMCVPLSDSSTSCDFSLQAIAQEENKLCCTNRRLLLNGLRMHPTACSRPPKVPGTLQEFHSHPKNLPWMTLGVLGLQQSAKLEVDAILLFVFHLSLG